MNSSWTLLFVLCLLSIGSAFKVWYDFLKQTSIPKLNTRQASTPSNNLEFEPARPRTYGGKYKGFQKRTFVTSDVQADLELFRKSQYRAQARFASYSIGQRFNGSVLSVHNFGMFVNINEPVNIFIPRSTIPRLWINNLKKLVNEEIEVEIVDFPTNQESITGRFLRRMVDALNPGHLKSVLPSFHMNGTVTMINKIGYDVFIPMYNASGIVPFFNLPDFMGFSDIKIGQNITVSIDHIDLHIGTVLLYPIFPGDWYINQNLTEVQKKFNQESWFAGEVIGSFHSGLHIRMPNSDLVGRLLYRDIPHEDLKHLIQFQMNRSLVPCVEVDKMFGPGDILNVRAKIATVEKNRLELSMNKLYLTEHYDMEMNDFKFRKHHDGDRIEAFYEPLRKIVFWKNYRIPAKPYVPRFSYDPIEDKNMDNTTHLLAMWNLMYSAHEASTRTRKRESHHRREKQRQYERKLEYIMKLTNGTFGYEVPDEVYSIGAVFDMPEDCPEEWKFENEQQKVLETLKVRKLEKLKKLQDKYKVFYDELAADNSTMTEETPYQRRPRRRRR